MKTQYENVNTNILENVDTSVASETWFNALKLLYSYHKWKREIVFRYFFSFFAWFFSYNYKPLTNLSTMFLSLHTYT